MSDQIITQVLTTSKQLPLNMGLIDTDNSYITVNDFQNKYAQSNDFFLLHINIRSINKNLERLEELLVELGKLPDIIAISETKLQAKFNFCLNGYNFIQNNSSTKAGGVGMFIKNHINYTVTDEYNLNCFGCEEMWIKINMNHSTKVFSVLYRHPKSNLVQFSESLENSLTILNKQKLTYYISGDTNIDLLQNKTNNNIKNYSDMLFSMGCLPLVKFPTRISNSSSTLIDHIYTNNILHKNTTYILINDLSDHLPVLTLLHIVKNTPKNVCTIHIRDTKNFNSEKFLNDLEEALRNLSCEEGSINNHFNNFISKFENVLNIHAPMRRQTKKEKIIMQKQWLTKGIIISSKIKNKLFQLSLNGKPEDIKRYKNYRNKLSHIKEQSKKNYFQKILTDSKHNLKLLWKTINDITKFKNKQQESIKEIVNDENKTITDPVEMANTFNTYFSTIGSKLASKIDKPSNNCHYSCNSYISNKMTSFFLNPITMYDIVKHINNLNPVKSSGPCKIPIKYIKMSMNIIAPLLAKLYNQCIIEGTFPSILKIAQVVPIFKNGPKEKCCNYKPISLLSPFSKIFEKCIYEQLYSYLNLNIVSAYAPQINYSMEEKNDFWEDLDGLIESISKEERIVLGADLNGHVGEGNIGDEEIMGRYGAGTRNKKGSMVVDFGKRMDLAIVNTYFKKKDKHRVTYKSGGKSTQVDYVMCRRRNLKEMCDCKVILNECVAKQHRMVVCKMALMVKKKKAEKVKPKIRW